MDAHASKQRTSQSVRRWAGALLALAALSSYCSAQGPTNYTGLDFAGRQFPVPVVAGPVTFSALKAWSWPQTDPVTGATVYRLAIEGDARVGLGPYTFHASRGVLWIEPLADDSGGTAYQVYGYLEQVSTPTAPAGMGVTADTLPIEGIIRPDTPPVLSFGVLLQEQPTDFPLVTEGERALADRLRRLDSPAGADLGAPQLLRPAPPRLLTQDPIVPGISTPGAPPTPSRAVDITRIDDGLDASARPQPIFAKDGVLTVLPGRVVAQPDGTDDTIVFDGGVVLQYSDSSSLRSLQITSKRAVVFVTPGTLGSIGAGAASISTDSITGIYLEGDAYVEGSDDRGRRYTLRAPSAFYDIANDRALLLDAVFWTYDAERGLPLYVRAKTLRQEAAGQFSASSARFTSTAFARPDFSIGAGTLKISLRERPSPEPGRDNNQTLVDARHVTLRAGDLPLFYWPWFYGDPDDIPLRDLRLENSSASGTALKAEWQLESLLGVEKLPGVTTSLYTDYYFERGVGGGIEASLNRYNATGKFFAYGLPDDSGTDVIGAGARFERDGEARGMALAEYRQRINDRWTLWLEGSAISDPAFVDAFFDSMAATRREFRNAAYLQWRSGISAASAEFALQADDFTPNEYLLQSPGYAVEKLPELRYAEIERDLFAENAPGLLTSSFDARATHMRLSFTEPTAREFGFRSSASALRALGVLPDQSVAEAARAAGLDEGEVVRLDAREQVTAHLNIGPVRFSPFVSARFTGYDTSFPSFSEDDDRFRLWAAAGARMSTSFARVYDGVGSRLLDLHRLRHIIEPHLGVMTAGTTVDRADLPVYDYEVESLLEGTIWRAGLDHTFQTQRGGPGRWRSVDVLKFRTELVVSSDDTDEPSPIGRYFASRPELSTAGTFVHADAAWQVTEVVALAGDVVHDLDDDETATASAGMLVRHNPDLSTFAEVRHVEPEETTYFNVGLNYTAYEKYTFAARLSYDIVEQRFQTAQADIYRRYPNILLGVGVSHDQVNDETSFGFTVVPAGVGTGGVQLRGGANAASGVGG